MTSVGICVRAEVSAAHSRAVTHNQRLAGPEAAKQFLLNFVKSYHWPLAADVLGSRDTDGPDPADDPSQRMTVLG